MKIIYRPILVILFMFLAGCAINHTYEWQEYPITADRITTQGSYTAGNAIKIINGNATDTKRPLGQLGFHRYHGNSQQLTDSVVKQLTKEMGKMQLDINNSAEKSIEVTVISSDFTQAALIGGRASCELTIKLANGKSKSYSVENTTPWTVPRAYNGLIARVVIQIMNDQDVLNYING